MGRKANPALIGAFVLGALALAAVGIVVFGSGRFFRETVRFVVYFDSSVNGLQVGAPVKFKGVEIGAVSKIMLSLTGMRRERIEETRIPVVIELDPELVTERGSPLDITKPATFEQLVAAGLRAQLAMQSILTGLLYVALDFFPDTPPRLVREPGVTYPEIPTVPTPLEEAQAAIVRVIKKVDQVDLDRIAGGLTEAVEGVERLINSPKVQGIADGVTDALAELRSAAHSVRTLADDLNRNVTPLTADASQTVKSATAAMKEAEAAFLNVRTLLEPGAPIAYQLSETLAEVAAAARTIRHLGNSLERNPAVLLRGRVSADGDGQ
jgi:paraquat-inducible protein B